MRWNQVSWLAIGGALLCWGQPVSAQSRIVPDRTLGDQNSNVVRLDEAGLPIDVIDGGAVRGSNLFHSFLEFNVGAGRGTYFRNPSDSIQNILTRVTGTNRSEILGTLGIFNATGITSSPNLFLINPNGIFFGRNASLDVPASFVGTTANAVRLGSTGLFSASAPETSNLLTVNPSAFLFNVASSSQIINRSAATGTATGLVLNGASDRSISGLQVLDGQSLLLLGGDVELSGGSLTVPSGRIELGSVAGNGSVSLGFTPRGLSLGYADAATFGNIRVSDVSFISAGGTGSGDIRIQGEQVTLEGFSFITSGITGALDGGDIIIRATDSLRIDGATVGTSGRPGASGNGGSVQIETGRLTVIGDAIPAAFSPSGFLAGGDIRTDTSGTGRAGDITIRASQVQLSNGAQISASTSTLFGTGGTGNAGNITIREADLVEISGRNPVDGSLSKIQSSVQRGATGQGGNVSIATNRLVVRDEAQIQAGVFGAGQGGSVTINAPQSIEIIAPAAGNDTTGILTGPEGNRASGNGGTLDITTGQLTLRGDGAEISNEVDSDATGNAGSTVVRVDRLLVSEGAQIKAGTSNTGRGGNLQITASDSVELSGVAGTGDDEERSGILIGTFGAADAGDLALTTPRLTVRGGATITASTLGIGQGTRAGTGRGGNITINAGSVEVSGSSADGSSSSIASEAGRFFGFSNRQSRAPGGNIRLTTGQLILQNGALISTQTDGAGNAGNLTINATGEVQLLEGNLRARSLGAGGAGDLTITARQLTMRDGEATTATINGGGRGGNITVTVSGTTELIGSDGGLAASSLLSSGDAGNLTLSTNRLIVRDGAGIATESIGRGRAGNLTIVVPTTIEVIGGRFRTGAEANALFNNEIGDISPFDPTRTYFFPSRISALVSSPSPDTPAANLTIQAGRLTVQNGGEISTQTLGSSAGGRLSIAALQIDLVGSSANLRSDVEANSSALSAQTSSTGNAGNIQLDVSRLQIADNAEVSAAASGRNNGSAVSRGAPGNILIQNADSVVLTGGGSISTEVEPGAVINTQPAQSGNITIQAQQFRANTGAQVTASTSGQGNAGNITITAPDRILLNGSTISSTVEPTGIGRGGNVTLNTGTLRASNLATLNTSTSGRGNAGNININADRIQFDTRATIGAINNAPLGGPNQRGGNIAIRTGTLSALNGAQILTSTAGQGRAGNIRIRARGAVTFDGADATGLSSLARTSVEATGRGRAGNIDLSAGSLSLTNSGQLVSSTFGQGRAGNVSVQVDRGVTLDRNALIQSGVSAGGVGNGGNVTVQAQSFSATNGSQIQALVFRPQGATPGGRGNGGDIRLNIDGSTVLAGVGATGFSSGLLTLSERGTVGRAGNITIDTDSLQVTDGAIVDAATFNANGSSGDVVVNARNLEVLNGGQILTNTRSTGNAGQIQLNVADTVTLSGADPAFAERRASVRQRLEQSNPQGDRLNDVIVNEGSASGLFASTDRRRENGGSGGRITVNTTNLNLADGATIAAQSRGSGTAGTLTLNATGRLNAIDSAIATSANQSSGGDISINSTADSGIVVLRNSDITTNSQGNGGNIDVRGVGTVAFGDSDILAGSSKSDGGNIRLGSYFGAGQTRLPTDAPFSADGQPDVSAEGNRTDGTVSTTDTSFIQNSLNELPDTAINTDRLLANSCIVRDRTQGRFTITGSGGLPESPDNDVASPYPTGTVQNVPEASSSRPWQIGDPIAEPQGVYQLPDGRLVMSRDCNPR